MLPFKNLKEGYVFLAISRIFSEISRPIYSTFISLRVSKNLPFPHPMSNILSFSLIKFLKILNSGQISCLVRENSLAIRLKVFSVSFNISLVYFLSMKEKILEKIIKECLKSKIKTREELFSIKRRWAKTSRSSVPPNPELLKTYHKLIKKKIISQDKNLEKILVKKPVRSLSGIINISVLTKPYPCPGRCIFCPQVKGIPRSYLPKEPAVMRALSLKFNPYSQVQKRILSLEEIGHKVDKIELRIIGGTWSYYPKKYQEWFIKKCFQGANDLSRRKKVRETSLKKEQRYNEKAKYKIIGITVETRPDSINIEEVKRMRKMGITRVEIGVQSIYDDVLKLVKRGHKVKEIIKATKILKDAGFKVLYQIMLNLPGSNPMRDIKMFKELFQNQNFQPDLLKIYPLALLKNTTLYQWYLKGKFKPYSKKTLINTLEEIKKDIPYYCRINRIIRDIPSEEIVKGGVKISNLRELVQREMRKKGIHCKCIRCREIKDFSKKEKIYLFRIDYQASGGREIFLSFENKNRRRLYALLRLRIPSFYFSGKRHFIKVLDKSSLIREVHTYGEMIPVGEKSPSFQHKGLGKKLIKEAEKITKKEFGLKKIAVIAGVGTRNYYRKLGYKVEETYMTKKLS